MDKKEILDIRGDWLKGAVIHLACQLRAVGDKFNIVGVEDDA